MSKYNWLKGTVLAALVSAAMLSITGTSEAQRRGWGWGPGGYDPWGYHSGGTGATTSGTAGASSNLQYYPAESLSNPLVAGFVVRLNDPSAEIWFENQKSKQQGTVRQYVSANLDPNYIYTFHIRARWTENGQQVEKTRNVDARSGQQVVVDFTGK
jgi:uncharacterized protein (TIGR03000 family)